MRQIAAEPLQRTAAAAPASQGNFVVGESGREGWNKPLVYSWLSFCPSQAAAGACRRTGVPGQGFAES